MRGRGEVPPGHIERGQGGLSAYQIAIPGEIEGMLSRSAFVRDRDMNQPHRLFRRAATGPSYAGNANSQSGPASLRMPCARRMATSDETAPLLAITPSGTLAQAAF